MAVLTNTMMQGTAAISEDTDFYIKHSLRLNEADSAHLIRWTGGNHGNRKTWTWAAWIKRWDPGNRSTLFSCGDTSSDTGWLGIEIETNNKLRVTGWNTLYRETNRIFRDPAAWFHVVVAWDTTQSTASDRVKMYVNGKLETSFGTSNDPAENAEHSVNEGNEPNRIGGIDPSGVNNTMSNFYLSDNYFIDGLALHPAAFGQFDSLGNWTAKEFALPTPNQGTTYSSSASSTGYVWDKATNNNNLFTEEAVYDGDLSTAAGPYESSGTAGTLTLPVGTQTGPHSYRIHGRLYADGKWEDQDGNLLYTSTADNNSYVWYDIGTHSDITSLKITAGTSGNASTVHAIEVDGVVLIDGQTNQTARSNPHGAVNGDFEAILTSNSSGGTDGFWGNGPGHGHWKQYGFDGNLTTNTAAATGDKTLTLTFNPALPWSKSIEVYIQSQSQVVGINGSTVLDGSATGAWDTVSTAGGELSTLTFTSKNTGINDTGRFSAIKIDGQWLRQDQVDNSFRLTFDNYNAIGENSLVNTVANSTGGLPIYNTSANGTVKGSGTRTDSNASDLIGAYPLDSQVDVSADIKGSGSNSNPTNSGLGGPSYGSAQAKYYGKCAHFQDAEGIVFPGSIFTGGDFQDKGTMEWWASVEEVRNYLTFWKNNNGNANRNDISYQTGSGLRWRKYSDNTYVEFLTDNEFKHIEGTGWHHYAVTWKSGTVKFYLDGVEEASASWTPLWDNTWEWGDSYVPDTDATTGASYYCQDIKFYEEKIYDGPFRTPSARGFKPGNLLARPDTIYSTRRYEGSQWGTHKMTGHKPDLILIKREDTTDNILVTDSMRGVTKELNTNNDTAETTQSGGVVKIFDAGFQLGNGTAGYNASGTNFWATTFKAGNGPVANTDGTISSTVNANVTGAFGIVKWTGTGSNGTIGHGLGRTPSVIWAKRYDNTGNWICYHKSRTATKYMKLNTTDTEVDDATAWQDTQPNSDVFSVGTLADLNTSGASMIAYIWCDTPGIISSGEYAGQNSTKTITTPFPFKYCFFKSYDSTGNQEWVWKNTAVGGDKTLYFDNTSAVATNRNVNFNSGNIEIASGSGATNSAGANYLYMGVGEQYRESDTDVVFDTPTDFEDEDTGISYGNYCTLNEFDRNGGSVLNGNLQSKNGTHGSWGKGWRGTMGVTSGKWYYEVENATPTQNANGVASLDERKLRVGVATFDWDLDGSPMTGFWGRIGPHGCDNGTEPDNAFTPHGFTEMNETNAGQKFGVALDMDAGKMYISTDGSFVDSDGSDHSPSTGNTAVGTSGGSYTLFNGNITGTVFPAVMTWGDSAETRFNFGQRPFTHDVPDGYKPWCTKHLPDIFSGDSLNNPSKYFDVLTYTGTGASQTIKGLEFQPDLVWCKNRDTTDEHLVFDAVRGVEKYIYPSLNSAEGTANNTLTAFNADGFTMGGSDGTNKSTSNMVTWNWDAGTAAVTASTDGSITPSAQWVNATAGFSISKYTGTGADATVGHGLSAAPEFIIVKNLDEAQSWLVYVKAVGNPNNQVNEGSYGLQLNTAGMWWYDAEFWNDTVPTNTVFSLGNKIHTNGSGDNLIAYCWTPIPGFSSFGGYAGSSSEKFIHTGFQPRWIMIKLHSEHITHAGWRIIDTARNSFNDGAVKKKLSADLNEAENGGTDISTSEGDIDILSNGFRITDNHSVFNTNGRTYLYQAFAEQPFKTARAR